VASGARPGEAARSPPICRTARQGSAAPGKATQQSPSWRRFAGREPPSPPVLAHEREVWRRSRGGGRGARRDRPDPSWVPRGAEGASRSLPVRPSRPGNGAVSPGVARGGWRLRRSAWKWGNAGRGAAPRVENGPGRAEATHHGPGMGHGPAHPTRSSHGRSPSAKVAGDSSSRESLSPNAGSWW